ncbi:UvrD-helicase domain-containing protein [Flagellimonas pacifica]|uniref:DNA 3'-5' helicase n=1 Tax=Flagellimonas pacifica TaxID=1247520 RepID=A0A285MEG6_9FLAO|nr:UvrD-helicase domain-containing protein [Allomuricauda parva]SNY94847.1 ATP-dependent exoDNAse (exonuclease V) beta subunit (contains helicase and exonuclease domains) [Allomuricauda parva]
MEVSNFEIYSASAGSGKTYSLAKEYLKLLLANNSPLKFRQILAITFTNKAVGEMKARILDNLYAFGAPKDPENQSTLFKEICHDLLMSPEELQQQAKLVLKRILHNYSFFEISTIDKFNHKIIKTFARDLQLSQSFEVELDTEILLEEAVGRLLERAGNDQELTEVLLAFSLEKIDEDKSWNISYDLVEIGKLLFQENHSSSIEALQSKSLHDFKEIQQKITSQLKSIEASVIEEAQKILVEMDNQGFAPSDFPRQTLPNHFKKIVAGEFKTKTLYNNKLEQNLLEGKILKATDKRDASHLASLVLEAFLLIKKKLYRRSYLKNIYGNIVPLTVLNEIAKEIKNIENEKDIIPISSLNSLLSKEIKDQPVPFIYERMGEKYRHYFIDEFQDTSQMQWENLIPLIGNALESENERKELGSLFIVGDVKQAIYRWRGGKVEQFLDLLNRKSHPFVVRPTIKTLDTNWRSYSEIIQFNNDFFTKIGPFLKPEDHKTLFLEGCNQKPNNRIGGYIQLSFLDKEIINKEEAYCHQVLEIINEVSSKKYAYSDICILVRDNKKGMLLANFLSQKQIPIVSSDSLLLGNNETVIFLISILKVLENTNDKESIYTILSFLAKDDGEKHDFIASYINNIEELLAKGYDFHLQNQKGRSVLAILENTIIHFNLNTNAAAYLNFLMDEALTVEKKDSAGIYSFLKHWELKKGILSIAAPDNVNAVKIMTIHKAKGLEFPIVIFPFANSIIDDKRKKKKSWVPDTPSEPDLGLDEFLINTNSEMLEYNDSAAAAYADEVVKTELDAINILYVALTRAEKGLYIISETGKPITTLANANSYSDLFQYFLLEKGLQENDQGVYTFGDLDENRTPLTIKADEQQYIQYITRDKKDKDFTISSRSSGLWDDEKRDAIEMGNLIHFALSHIRTADNVPKVLEELELLGRIPKDASQYVKEKVLSVVNHPQLIQYFSSGYEILNEQEILTVNGASLRPDRIVIFDNEAIIIDYKTGKPSPSHKEQIMQYATVLKEMGYKIKHSIIIYIDQKINLIFL